MTSHGVESLTMRVQFDATAALPSRRWYFAEMPDLGRLEVPDPSEGRDLGSPASAMLSGSSDGATRCKVWSGVAVVNTDFRSKNGQW